MSVEADDPRGALFVFHLPSFVLCLAVLCLRRRRSQAIKEWIPDDESYLDWFHRHRKPNKPDTDWFDQSPA